MEKTERRAGDKYDSLTGRKNDENIGIYDN